MLIPVLSLLGTTLSFKYLSRRFRPSRSLQTQLSSDENIDMKVLKAQFILGMVDSLSDELTKAISSSPHDQVYLYDDLLSSISHKVTEGLLQPENLKNDIYNAEPAHGIKENISYSLILIPTADIPQTSDQHHIWTSSLLPVHANTTSQAIQLTPLVVPLKFEGDPSLSDNVSSDKALTSAKGRLDMIVSVALRYCLPPVIAQWLPHRLPQLVAQWVHEHWF